MTGQHDVHVQEKPIQTLVLGEDRVRHCPGNCNMPRRVRLLPKFIGIAIPVIGFLFISAATAQLVEPKIKPLAPAADPQKKAALIGRVTTNAMVVQLELEGSEPMWMQMGSPPAWGPHQPTADERYHVELKLTDPKSKTRIPYAKATFSASNAATGNTMVLELPPMWGKSGLHYSANSALLGDGAYAATVTVDMPTFHRELKDKDLWSKPTSAKFHFKLKDGKLTEVSAVGP